MRGLTDLVAALLDRYTDGLAENHGACENASLYYHFGASGRDALVRDHEDLSSIILDFIAAG